MFISRVAGGAKQLGLETHALRKRSGGRIPLPPPVKVRDESSTHRPHYRDKVNPQTSPAPPLLRTLPTSFRVVPVVITSSNTTILAPFSFLLLFKAKTSFKFIFLCFPLSSTWGTVEDFLTTCSGLKFHPIFSAIIFPILSD